MASCFGETKQSSEHDDRYSELISLKPLSPGFAWPKNLHKSVTSALFMNDFDVISSSVAKLYIFRNLIRVFVQLVLCRPTCSTRDKHIGKLIVSLRDLRLDWATILMNHRRLSQSGMIHSSLGLGNQLLFDRIPFQFHFHQTWTIELNRTHSKFDCFRLLQFFCESSIVLLGSIKG